jgi:hypothetical protein
MPASLKRSAKAVHPEGYRLFFGYPACYPKRKIARSQWAKILNNLLSLDLSSRFWY